MWLADDHFAERSGVACLDLQHVYTGVEARGADAFACLAAAAEADVIPEIEENVPEAPAEGYAELTLEALLGEDYVEYLTETITMQMGNRMDKTPDVRFFPIVDQKPLSDYVAIDEQTKFEVDEKGNPVIFFPAGTVTDAEHGEQSFIIPKLYQ